MAIVASNLYPSRIITGDTGYPYGKARDLVNGEKGTGTPLRATWVNDQWGFLQALLDAADIIPSGSADEVGNSQYLDAIRNIVREPLQLKIFQSPTDNLTKIETFAGDVGVVYQVRKTSDNSLATIYSDKDGVNEIAQNGTSNISDDNAECVFYIAEGDYTVTINSVSTGLSVARLQTLRAHEASTTNPHNVTKAQIGLGSVDNVSSANLRDRGTHTGTQTLSTISDAGSAASRNVATTAEAIAGTSNKLPDTIGVKALLNSYGVGGDALLLQSYDEVENLITYFCRLSAPSLPTGYGYQAAHAGNYATRFWGRKDRFFGQSVENGVAGGAVEYFHTGNANFNEFGTAAGVTIVATGSGYNSTSAFIHLNTAFLNGKASSLTVTGTFELRNAAQAVIKTNIPATDISLSIGGDRVTRILVSNLTGVTTGDFVELRALTTESKIKVNF